MSFVKAIRIVFLPCTFLGIHLVNLKNPRNDTHSKSLWKFIQIVFGVVSVGISLWKLYNYPLVTLKDLVLFGLYLSFTISTWPLFYVTIYRSNALKQLYIKFYDLSENAFYSETNYHSVFVFCQYLTLIAVLLHLQDIYSMDQNWDIGSFRQLLFNLVEIWVDMYYNYSYFLITTYIFLLSRYLSEINTFLDKNFINRKFLRILIDIYTKIYELADDVINMFDLFLMFVFLCQFLWLIWIMYSKIYILVEIGFISANEIFDLIKSISLSISDIGILLWVCSKTKNMVSFYCILIFFNIH